MLVGVQEDFWEGGLGWGDGVDRGIYKSVVQSWST